ASRARLATPRFYEDDPIAHEPSSQDASTVQPWTLGAAADLLINLFATPLEPVENVRAENVNTIDEVPDSEWFTNRIYAHRLSVDDIVRGPNTSEGPAPGKWTVMGLQPDPGGIGFTVRDERGELWLLELDQFDFHVASTAGATIATKIFWAIGYHQVESHLARLRVENLVVAPMATVRTASGEPRPMTLRDVERELARASRDGDGSYRVIARRALPGRPIGGFKFSGTRPDDPNDIVPHEHRRELRALKVFGAWANLVDMSVGTTSDTVIPQSGRQVVRHYLHDVGSSFGTEAAGPRDWPSGYEYLFEGEAVL